MQRRELTNRLKEGFSRSDSARALIILLPILSSLAQEGTRPQRSSPSLLLDPVLMTAGICCMGAALYVGA
ncbi:hypothetical protein D3C76_1571730 [compost metagenome]